MIGRAKNHWNTERAAAAARVKAYFRAAGVSDEALLEDLGKRLLDEATASDMPQTETISSRALHRAILTLQEWLDEQFGPSSSQPEAARGILAWRLRQMRDGAGNPLLLNAASSGAFNEWVRASAAPVVPAPRRGQMPRQALGALPPVLCSTFWRSMWRRIRESALQTCRILWGE